MRRSILIATTILSACGGLRPMMSPPRPNADSAPSLRGASAMVFPVQFGRVPSEDKNAKHWPVDRAALDAEISYWLGQGPPGTRWFLTDDIDRAIRRSPSLDINPRSLAVGVFERAQVRTIGDPLFGDLARLAAVFDARIAVLPIAAEFIGASPDSAVLNIATAVVDATDGDVIWFGVIAGNEAGRDSGAAIASAARAFARAFTDKHAPETEKE